MINLKDMIIFEVYTKVKKKFMCKNGVSEKEFNRIIGKPDILNKDNYEDHMIMNLTYLLLNETISFINTNKKEFITKNKKFKELHNSIVVTYSKSPSEVLSKKDVLYDITWSDLLEEANMFNPFKAGKIIKYLNNELNILNYDYFSEHGGPYYNHCVSVTGMDKPDSIE